MTTREEILRQRTFKEEGFPTEERVWRSVWQGGGDEPQILRTDSPEARHAERTMHRTLTLVGHLIKHLEEKGLLTEADLDNWLVDVTTRA